MKAAATTAPARPATGARPAPPRPRLALVPPMAAHAPKAPFVVLVAMLLLAGLGGLLFLHTALAEDSFRLHDLQVRSAKLADREQALEQEVSLDASPRVLARRAEALGMVRSENPAFIRLSDGRILGKPKAGVAPPPPTPSPSASGSPAPSAPAAPSASPSPSGGSGPTPGGRD